MNFLPGINRINRMDFFRSYLSLIPGLCFMFLVNGALAQNKPVRGTVISEETGEKIALPV